MCYQLSEGLDELFGTTHVKDLKNVELTNSKILITGASGSLAKQLVHDLVAAGIKPIAHLRESSDSSFVDQHNLEKRLVDFYQDQDLSGLVEGIDIIIHCAAWVNFRRDSLTRFTTINTFAAVNLFQTAQKAGVKRFVQVSTVGAVGAVNRRKLSPEERRRGNVIVDEDSDYNLGHFRIPYLMTKRAADDELLKAAKGSNTELVIVCPSIIVAPSRSGDDRGKSSRMFSRWFIPNISIRANLVDIRDVSPGVLAAATKGRHLHKYILAGDNIAVRDLVLDISSELGKIPHLIRIPRQLLNLLARFSLWWGKITGRSKISFYPDLVKMLDYDWTYSSLKARHELGYVNRSINTTLHDLLSNDMHGTCQKPSR